jgi:Salmonella virulence plasmid 65kDa B protein
MRDNFEKHYTKQLTSSRRRAYDTGVLQRLWWLPLGPLLLAAAAANATPDPAAAADSVVSANTGAAQLSIPIEAPPGPGGFAPKLALRYSSNAGDGPFGVGWSLNLGEIRCSARFGVPDYANCTKYELNGQILVGPTGGVYHTFVESFQKIEFGVGSGCSGGWTVTDPNGIVSRYGCTAQSRILASAGGATARWVLDQMVDPFGNEINVTYSPDPDTDPNTDADLGFTYPVEVSYADGDRVIRFLYEARPDPIHDFAGGVEREITRRATAIEIESYQHPFRRQALGYDLASLGQAPAEADYSTHRSRLAWTRIEGKDAGGWVSLPPQVFRYRDPTDELGASAAATAQWVEGGGYDVNLTLDDPYSFKFQPQYLFGDINGDGLIDRIEGSLVNHWTPISVYINDGSSFVRSEEWSAAFAAVSYPRPRMNLTTRRGD